MGVFLVFVAAAFLYSYTFSDYAKKLNKKPANEIIAQSEAYSVVRSFISVANKKDEQELLKRITKRGLDLGWDIFLEPKIKLIEVVGSPHTTEREISALVLAFDEEKAEFTHFVLLFIKDETDNWFLYGLFRQKDKES